MLLALETATDICSVALVDEGRLVGMAEVFRPRAHAASLVPLVRDVLAQADATTADLAAVAVSAGPGSYTGLRIGASTAKGLAWVHDLALVAVPSLEGLAAGTAHVLASGDLLVTAFRSRRGEVYAAAFRLTEDGLSAAAPVAALPLDALPDWLPDHEGTCWVAGEAGPQAADALRPGTDLRVLGAHSVRPSAASIGMLGWSRWQEGRVEDVASFEPEYLKDFVAKRGGSIFERLPG